MQRLDEVMKNLWLAWNRWRYPEMFEGSEKITKAMVESEWPAARRRIYAPLLVFGFVAGSIGLMVALKIATT